MAFLTNEKLTIVGAAGMIGSNMVQTALMMGLTSEICLYDVFSPEGVAEEMRQCGFGDVKITATTDVKEALTNAKYIISSGGAPRKEGMTREDLLAGNCKIAEELGKNIKAYCPDVKHVVIIFNPADLTGLVTLLYHVFLHLLPFLGCELVSADDVCQVAACHFHMAAEHRHLLAVSAVCRAAGDFGLHHSELLCQGTLQACGVERCESCHLTRFQS